MPDARDDRFDEVRRAWIARHQGWSTIQRRRAELLGRQVRARQRSVVAAVPDPHDDTSLPPLVMRPAESPASRVELVCVVGCAVLVPIGWLGGHLLRSAVTQLIPGTLRGYPIATLLWSGAVLGLPIVALYDPAPTFGQMLLVPWICVQLTAVPVVAGVYGIAEGWLAVTGSNQWWPLTPPKRPLTADDAAQILGPYDATGPGLFDARPLPSPGERTHPW